METGVPSSLQNPSETYQNAGTYTVTLTSSNSEGSSTNTASQTISVVSGTATTVPTMVFTTAPTFAVGAEATTSSSVDNWLAQQNAEIATPTKKSPGYDALAALIGCGAVAGIALRRRH